MTRRARDTLVLGFVSAVLATGLLAWTMRVAWSF